MWLLFIAVAASLNAVMDTLTHHFGVSIFKKKKPSFWNPEVSWKEAKRIGGYKLDAWHMFKSGMIVLLCVCPLFYAPVIHPSLDWMLAGLVWNCVFNIFYNRILI
jgi:hypothetical protein